MLFEITRLSKGLSTRFTPQSVHLRFTSIPDMSASLVVFSEKSSSSKGLSARFTPQSCCLRFTSILDMFARLLVPDEMRGSGIGCSAWFALENCDPRFDRPKFRSVVDVFATHLVAQKLRTRAKKETACHAGKSLLGNMLLTFETGL